MSVSMYFIEGRKGSVCSNDVYSVVYRPEGREPLVLDFVPAARFHDPLKRQRLTTAYETAIGLAGTEDAARTKCLARRLYVLRLI